MKGIFIPVYVTNGKLATTLKASMVNYPRLPEEITLEPDTPFTTNRGVGFRDFATAITNAGEGQTIVRVEAEEIIPVSELVGGKPAVGVVNAMLAGIFPGRLNPADLGRAAMIYKVPIFSPEGVS